MAGLIEHSGVITDIQGDRTMVQVALAGCGSCGHQSQCGMGKLSSKKSASMSLLVDTVAGIAIGDTVTLTMPESRLSFYALLGYFIPALSFLVGAIGGEHVGAQFGATDAGTALGAMALMLLSLAVVRGVKRRFPSHFPMPKILQEIPKFRRYTTGYRHFEIHAHPSHITH